MWSRRQFLSRGSAGVLGLAGATLALPGDGAERPGGSSDGSAARGMITPETDTAINRGLAYLAASRRGGAFGQGNYHGNIAVTSLSALAFMAAGHQPERGKYGRLVTEALRHVLGQARDDADYPGYLYNPLATPRGPMYGHGFGTLFLGEVLGMVHAPELRTKLRRTLKLALQVIVKSQSPEGGWRYYPHTRDADLSVTVCQIMALRSARNAGFAVPATCVDRCIRYVKRCQHADGHFRYTPQGGGPPDTFARTGAGLSALFSAGVYEGAEIERGLRYLLDRCKPGTLQPPSTPDLQYFYGHYYAAQAMWTAGDRWWSEWFPAIRDELLRMQRRDGSWEDTIDAHYATAMACIILQIPNNYLPILQK